MSKFPVQTIEFTARDELYPAIDPQKQHKDSASGKVDFIVDTERRRERGERWASCLFVFGRGRLEVSGLWRISCCGSD